MTVLFAEVAAPAGLPGAGTLGLEALREIVGGSLAAVIAEVEALGGTVISVSGRGLEAMFGAPEAHEDDPERALRAAFRALTRRRRRPPPPTARRRCGSAWRPAPRWWGRSAAAPRWSTARSATWSAWRPRCSRRRGRAPCWSARRPGRSPATCSAGARPKRSPSAAIPGRWSPATWTRRGPGSPNGGHGSAAGPRWSTGTRRCGSWTAPCAPRSAAMVRSSC